MSIEDDIAELEEILNVGLKQVTTDGVTVNYDLDAVRRRLAELRGKKSPAARPRIASIDLSKF